MPCGSPPRTGTTDLVAMLPDELIGGRMRCPGSTVHRWHHPRWPHRRPGRDACAEPRRHVGDLVGTLTLVLVKPRGWNEAFWPALGAIAMILFELVTPRRAFAMVWASRSALLFLLALLLLSALLEVSGFFEWAALHAGHRARGDGRRLFRNVFVLGVLVTTALSLDTTAVMLTPIVIAFVKRLRLPARPYVIASAFVANIASLALPMSSSSPTSSSRTPSRIRFGRFACECWRLSSSRGRHLRAAGGVSAPSCLPSTRRTSPLRPRSSPTVATSARRRPCWPSSSPVTSWLPPFRRAVRRRLRGRRRPRSRRRPRTACSSRWTGRRESPRGASSRTPRSSSPTSPLASPTTAAHDERSGGRQGLLRRPHPVAARRPRELEPDHRGRLRPGVPSQRSARAVGAGGWRPSTASAHRRERASSGGRRREGARGACLARLRDDGIEYFTQVARGVLASTGKVGWDVRRNTKSLSRWSRQRASAWAMGISARAALGSRRRGATSTGRRAPAVRTESRPAGDRSGRSAPVATPSRRRSRRGSAPRRWIRP